MIESERIRVERIARLRTLLAAAETERTRQGRRGGVEAGRVRAAWERIWAEELAELLATQARWERHANDRG